MAEFLGRFLDERGGLPVLVEVENGRSEAGAHPGASTSLDIDLYPHGGLAELTCTMLYCQSEEMYVRGADQISVEYRRWHLELVEESERVRGDVSNR